MAKQFAVCALCVISAALGAAKRTNRTRRLLHASLRAVRSQNDAGVERYAAFIRANPDWPSIPLLRRRRNHLTQVLRVHTSRKRRGAYKVREQHGDLAALGSTFHGLRSNRPQRLIAGEMTGSALVA